MESEIDISHYILKRACPGSEYSVIATIPGKGNSPQPQRYTYVDEDVEQQVSYRYLLGVVDSDGKEGWVGSVTVTTRAIKPALKVISSNPLRGMLHMSYTMASSGWLDVEIRDAAGRIVESIAHGYFSSGEHDFFWITELVSEGIYFIVVRGESITETRKVVLIR
jgi:hypothetical protein